MSEGKSNRTPTLLPWNFPGASWNLGDFPKIMGIVNVTPDSFSDGGQYLDRGLAVEHAAQLVAMGADLLDIGGESTRPGASPVPIDEELRRVLPVIERIVNGATVPLAIDTRNAEVARRALDAGAVIVNDVSGLTFDPAMASVCAEPGPASFACTCKARPPRCSRIPIMTTCWLKSRPTWRNASTPWSKPAFPESGS